MNMKFHLSRRADAVITVGAKSFASICVAASTFLLSAVSMAQPAPQKVQTGPGTAVVAPGVDARHLALDEIPPAPTTLRPRRRLFDTESTTWASPNSGVPFRAPRERFPSTPKTSLRQRLM